MFEIKNKSIEINITLMSSILELSVSDSHSKLSHSKQQIMKDSASVSSHKSRKYFSNSVTAAVRQWRQVLTDYELEL